MTESPENKTTGLNSVDDPIDDAIADFLNRCENGQKPAPQSFIEEYPHLRHELIEFFDNQTEFAMLATPLREIQNALLPLGGRSPQRDFGDYTILEEIGRGGMGVIFRARQKSLQRTVALKMIHGNNFNGRNDVIRFQREAEAAASLDHPHIVPIYEVGEYDGFHFFTMKIAHGGNLQQLIQSGLAIRSSVVALQQVARAIHYAHQKGILHRDLKPSNVLLDFPIGDTAELKKTVVEH